jgi:hypothetical protein
VDRGSSNDIVKFVFENILHGKQNWDDKHTLIIKLELVVLCFQTLKEIGSISYLKNEIIKDHWIKPSNESLKLILKINELIDWF